MSVYDLNMNFYYYYYCILTQEIVAQLKDCSEESYSVILHEKTLTSLNTCLYMFALLIIKLDNVIIMDFWKREIFFE